MGITPVLVPMLILDSTDIQGDAINPIMAAVGYDFRLILKWIRFLWFQIWIKWITSPSAIIA